MKPNRIEKEFSKFSVDQVCNEHVRLGKFNIGKQKEYGNLYIHVSHLYDVAS